MSLLRYIPTYFPFFFHLRLRYEKFGVFIAPQRAEFSFHIAAIPTRLHTNNSSSILRQQYYFFDNLTSILYLRQSHLRYSRAETFFTSSKHLRHFACQIIHWREPHHIVYHLCSITLYHHLCRLSCRIRLLACVLLRQHLVEYVPTQKITCA